MRVASSIFPTTNLLRNPWLVLLAGSTVALIALGMRHSFGLFLNPVTNELPSVDRESFGFAVALQNLMWGLAQPFAGMIADRFGSARVIFVGGALYATGLICASASSTALGLTLGLGVLVGIGLSATAYAVVLGAVGRRFPPNKRTTALGIASLGGSIGIFLSVPVTLALIDTFSWAMAFVSLALIAITMCIMAPMLSGRAIVEGPEKSLRAALEEAFSHKGFLLLVLGFFVCGFQLAFIGTHLPAYLMDRHLDVWLGGAALATIGLTNIFGTLACGAIGGHPSKKNVLAALYLTRAAVVIVFVLLPPSAISTLLFSATIGSYDLIWWIVALLGVVAAMLHLPIDERPVAASEPLGSRRLHHG